MKKYPKCIYAWDGHVFMPLLHYTRLAESSFTAGEAYRMIVDEEQSAKRNRRTLEQNSKLWAMLHEIRDQAEHNGRKYSPDEWKILMMHACNQDTIKFLPALDDKTFIPYGGRSSHMTIPQMAELIEFMRWWGTQHGVKFRDDEGVTYGR